MAGFYSGKEGELLINGTKVAKVRSWSFTFNQAVLETVSLEDTDRTIIHGTRSYTGSASVYYYQGSIFWAISWKIITAFENVKNPIGIINIHLTSISFNIYPFFQFINCS